MFSQKSIDRFYKKVEKTDTCWNWLGCCNKLEYGRMKVNSIDYLVHRFQYELYHNKLLDDNILIRHTCDNNKCVNPEHLKEQVVNNSYSITKNKSIKLSKDQIDEIRLKYWNGTYLNQIEMSKYYNISKSHISNILSRKTRKNL
jgi:hypothetical protein